MKEEVDPELTVQRKYSSSFARWRLGKLSIGPKLITTPLRSLCSGRDSTWCLGCVVAVGVQAARLRTAVGTRPGSAFAHIHTFSSEGRRCANHIAPLGRRADGAWQISAGVHSPCTWQRCDTTTERRSRSITETLLTTTHPSYIEEHGHARWLFASETTSAHSDFETIATRH
jgi:hypothetical protein